MIYSEMRPAGFEPATKGFKISDSFLPAWTISPSDTDFLGNLYRGRALNQTFPEEYLNAGIIVEAHPASL